MSERWKLKDCHAVVIGGTRGIGRAVVEELMELGAAVTIVARQKDDIERLQQDAARKNRKLDGIPADVSTSEGFRSIKQWADSRSAPLHILINNVGTNIRKKAVDYDSAEFDYLMRTNFGSIWELTRMLYPCLKAAHGSSVVNIGFGSRSGRGRIRRDIWFSESRACAVDESPRGGVGSGPNPGQLSRSLVHQN